MSVLQPIRAHSTVAWPHPPLCMLWWTHVWVGFSWCSLARIWLLCCGWQGRLAGAVMPQHASPTNILQCLPSMPALGLEHPLLLSFWR